MFLLHVFSESPFFSRGPSINTVVSLPRISHQDVWESESRMLQVIPITWVAKGLLFVCSLKFGSTKRRVDQVKNQVVNK